MKRETAIAAVALAVTSALCASHDAAAQAVAGPLARASFIEIPKDQPPAAPADGQAPKQEGPAETPAAEQPAPQASEPAKPAENTPPSAQPPPPAGKEPAAQAPADPKQAAEQAGEKQRAENEDDAAKAEEAAAAKAPKRFIPTQKSQADSSATFPVDI